MARQYFGTDGIRGTVGQKPITPDFILRLAHAVGRVLKSQEAHPTVLIGKDTRISGYMLESALESGFNSAGVDVVLLGPVPTPAVAYLTRAQRASLGVVISASHNPFADNGIKFFSAQGTKLSDAWEEAVEAALLEDPVWVDSAALGKTRRLDDAAGRYIEFCKSTFSNDLTLKGLKIVVDAAHGAAYQIAPKVFHELGAEVVATDLLERTGTAGVRECGELVDGVRALEVGGDEERRVAGVLVRSGHHVLACDADTARAAATGAETAELAAVAASPIVLLSLPSSREVEVVVEGPGGLLEHGAAGLTIVDLTTADPASTRRLHARCAEQGIAFVDAGVTGGAAAAEQGTLVVLVLLLLDLKKVSIVITNQHYQCVL